MKRSHPLVLLPLLCLSLPALGVAAIASASFDASETFEMMSTGWYPGDDSSGGDASGIASATATESYTSGWDGSDDGGASYTSGWDLGGGETGYADTGWDASDDGASDDGGGSDTGDDTGEFIDLWEPGEPGEPEDSWLLEFLLALFGGDDDDTGGDETGYDETGYTGDADTGDADTGESGETGEDDKKPKGCAAGEFTIFTYVKFLNGAEGTVSIAAGTLTELGEEKEGTTLYKEYLACIPGDKIVGPKAPGVRITAAVKGTNPADRVVGLRRGIDKTWISKCVGDPAKSCWIDAKFNAEGKNTLPIAVAIVFVEFNRIEVAPMPKEVIKP